MKPRLPTLPAPLAWPQALRRWLGAVRTPTPIPTAGKAPLDLTQRPGEDGRLVISMSRIRAVAIADLTEVRSHDIFRIVGSTSHVVRFNGGGELRYAHNDRGQVIALDAAGLRSEVSPLQVVTFRAGMSLTPVT